MSLTRTLRRLLHAFDNHGASGMLQRALTRRRGPESPHRGPADFTMSDTPHPFDLQHGTDTGGYVPGEHLNSGNKAADLFNTAYYGISPSTLHAAITHLPESPEQFTFVDLGCGKGRALLIAAMHGFRSVLGVELSPALCLVARSNASKFSSIQVRQGDAAIFRYPEGPLVVFLYHPFLAPLLRRVLRNLQRQLRLSPRPCYLLYANCTYPKVMRSAHASLIWSRTFALTEQDAAADRHGTSAERYDLWQISR